MSCEKKHIVILGCTGSIGTQTLDVVRQHSDKLQVVGLSAHTRRAELEKYAREFGVSESMAVLGDANGAGAACAGGAGCGSAEGAGGVGSDGAEDAGGGAACAIKNLIEAEDVDIVVNALVGAAGVRASYDALKAGKTLALANKESLVVAGDIIMPLARELDAREAREQGGCVGSEGTREQGSATSGEGTRAEAPANFPAGAPIASGAHNPPANSPLTRHLMPIDSEHGAIYQCLLGENSKDIAKLWVTASGGPFRGRTRDQLKNITPAQALAHPTWNMGAKISIDSSTLMNKGLEVIEAHHLFGVAYDKIEVVVQPQSAIHSMVEYVDGSVLAHLGTTDMRIPIQFALSAPARWAAPVQPLDFRTLGHLDFEAPDTETFRCLALAGHAGRVGGTLPCVMNAANEVAVAAFLREECAYLEIAQVVEFVMNEHERAGVQKAESIDQLLEIDAWARTCAKSRILPKTPPICS